MIASEGEERRWWESVWCEAEQRQDMADPPPAAPQARGEGALSPLSGSYLLIVVAEPKTAQHKDVILNRISKGKSRIGVARPGAALNSWRSRLRPINAAT